MVESVNDWKKALLDDENFEQKTQFNYDICLKNFQEAEKDLENINIYYLLRPIWEITKAFKALSTALSVGFSDITSKVDIWRINIKTHFPDAKSVQDVIEKEIELKIHELNGENNSKLGHKKKTPYHDFTSSTRTMLRLSWFLNFFKTIIDGALNKPEKTFADCIKESYETVLAPHHPWLVRKGAAVGISFAPAKREKAMKAFFAEEKWDDEVKAKIKDLYEVIDRIWRKIHSIYETKNLLDLP